MQLLPNESVLLEAIPVRRLSVVWLFSKGLFFALRPTIFVFIAWMIFNSSPEKGAPAPYSFGVGCAVVASAFGLFWALAYAYDRLLVQTFRYQVTSQRFIFTGGILRRVTHAVEHRRVTDIQLSQNLIEQWLSLSTISLFTSGTASVSSGRQPMPELLLEGLPNGPEVFALVSDCIRRAKGGES